jgi:RpiB/LacA/LacB family sugar-phosphate isomerase
LITETDARQLEPGTTVELERGGHVTPLAKDTLAERRVTVVPAGTIDPALPADLGPVSPVRTVVIGADHTGLALRTAILNHLRQSAIAVTDVGAQSTDPVDYPDVAAAVGRAVARGEADAGILIDGSGLGSAMAANKLRGVRAAMCQTPTLARYAREHIGANVLALGATLLTPPEAIEIVKTWVGTAMTEARYLRRLIKVRRLEEGR